MKESQNARKKRTGGSKYFPDKSKPMYPFSSDCIDLKKFIQSTFMDYELIDYDELHKLDDRNTSRKSYAELTAELSEES